MSVSDWRNLKGIPLQRDEPVFEEPWQAQAFAMAVALNERGVFDWSEWARTLGAQIASDETRPYWVHWLAALEMMMAQAGIASSDAIEVREREWHEAAARTPHGAPIEL